MPQWLGLGGAKMISGTTVRFRKKLVLSLFVPIFLVGWAVIPMSEAGYQSNFNISNNGTGYFAFPGGYIR